MKKLMMILVMVGLIRIGGAIYYETKIPKQPIIIASEVNEMSNSIHLSYITNVLRPSEFHSIEIDGMHYFPQHPFLMFGDEAEPAQLETYAKYTYYSIIAPTIWLQDEEEMSHLAAATEGVVYFKDGYSEKVTLTLRKNDESPFLHATMGSAGSDGTTAIYEIREPFTLQDVNVVENRVTITSFKLNNKEVTLPLTSPVQFNRDDTLLIATTDGMARFMGELFTVELSGIDEQQKEIVIPIFNNLNRPPSADWVEQIVKERGGV